MPKGTDQVVEAAGLCRGMASSLSELDAPTDVLEALQSRLESVAARLEALQPKFFLKMGPAVRYTTSCLEAARAARGALDEDGPSDALAAKVGELEQATTTLEDRANAAGNMTIT